MQTLRASCKDNTIIIRHIPRHFAFTPSFSTFHILPLLFPPFIFRPSKFHPLYSALTIFALLIFPLQFLIHFSNFQFPLHNLPCPVTPIVFFPIHSINSCRIPRLWMPKETNIGLKSEEHAMCTCRLHRSVRLRIFVRVCVVWRLPFACCCRRRYNGRIGLRVDCSSSHADLWTCAHTQPTRCRQYSTIQ